MRVIDRLADNAILTTDAGTIAPWALCCIWSARSTG